MAPPSPPLRVVVFGPTGAAGAGVLKAALDSPDVAEALAVTRRPLGVRHPKLRELACAEFTDLAPLRDRLAGVDACFYCLGISVGQAPDPAKYREITLDYTLAAARALLAASPGHHFHFISGQGTHAHSRMMWARVKGETELALQQLGLSRLTCWRPAYIHPLTPREQPAVAERIVRTLYPLLRGLSGMSVEAEQIGQAMLEAQRIGRTGVVDNREIRTLAAAYRSRTT